MEAAQKALEEQEQQKVSSESQRIAESERFDSDGGNPEFVVSRNAIAFGAAEAGPSRSTFLVVDSGCAESIRKATSATSRPFSFFSSVISL